MQALSLERRTAAPFVVLEAVGELDVDTQTEFEGTVSQVLGSSPVVIDLSRVDFLAISALRSMIMCHRLAQSLGHALFFAEATPQTLRLLRLSGLDAVLPLAPTVAAVVSGPQVARAGEPLTPLG